MSSGKRNLAGLKWRKRFGAQERQTMKIAAMLAVVIAGAWGIWATSTDAAPRPVVPVPAEVVSAEMVVVYDAMLIPTVKPVDFTGWAAAERVAMTAEALAVAAQPESRMTWQPGFEAYLREVLQFGDEEIVDAVYLVLGKRAVRLAETVFQQMPKPSP